METRELRYFVAVAEELHFARAAARVGIEQSPLSKAITQMERHLGVRLFIRTRRSTQLTAAGDTLLGDARRILADVDAAERRLSAVAAGRRGCLRLALGGDLAHPRISKLIAETRCDEPDIDIEVIHASLIVQLAELRAGRIDVGFVLEATDLSALFAQEEDSERSHILGDDIHVVYLWKDAVVAIVKPGSIIAAQSVARLSDLTAGPIVLVGEPTQSRSGRQYDVKFVANVDVLLTLVGAGRGIGLINAAQAETLQWSDLVVRPLESSAAQIQTLLLSRELDRATLVMRFAERAQRSVKGKTR
jgi:DNA-binding transcriptional LysR family regulator